MGSVRIWHRLAASRRNLLLTLTTEPDNIVPNRPSNIEVVEVPDFQPTLPHFLAIKLTEQEIAILEALSKIEQQGAWTAEKMVRIFEIAKSQDERLIDLEAVHRDNKKLPARVESLEESRESNTIWTSKASLVGQFLVTAITILCMTVIPKVIQFVLPLLFSKGF